MFEFAGIFWSQKFKNQKKIRFKIYLKYTDFCWRKSSKIIWIWKQKDSKFWVPKFKINLNFEIEVKISKFIWKVGFKIYLKSNDFCWWKEIYRSAMRCSRLKRRRKVMAWVAWVILQNLSGKIGIREKHKHYKISHVHET